MQTAGGSIGARVRVEGDQVRETVVPRMAYGGAAPQPAVALPGGGGAHLRLQSLNADAGTVTLLYGGGDAPADGRAVGGILTIELNIKPMMSLLWTGVILVLLGGGFAVWRRVVQLSV